MRLRRLSSKAHVSSFTFSLNLGDGSETDEFDPLTGMLMRRAFLGRLAEVAQLAADSLSPFSICIVDVDQLRNVNDQHGQETGDEVLLAVADRLREVLADTTHHPNEYLLARFDGNSFLLLTQKTDVHQAAAIAERLRSTIGETPTIDGVRVTVSAGVAQYRIGESTDDTLARAEQALNLAKQSGRDRVEIIETPTVTADPADVVVPWDRSA